MNLKPMSARLMFVVVVRAVRDIARCERADCGQHYKTDDGDRSESSDWIGFLRVCLTRC